MKVEMSAETYQVGAHFKALIKAILVAPLKSFERFFRISSSPAGLCSATLLGPPIYERGRYGCTLLPGKFTTFKTIPNS